MAPRRTSSGPHTGANGQVEAFARGLVTWMPGQRNNGGLTGRKIGTDDGDFDVMALRGVLLPLRGTEAHPE